MSEARNEGINEELGTDLEGADLLTLVDEDGTEHEFEIIDSLEHDGVEYLALVTAMEDADEDEDSGELVILKVAMDGDEEVLEAIESDEEFERVGALFKERLREAFDFED